MNTNPSSDYARLKRLQYAGRSTDAATVKKVTSGQAESAGIQPYDENLNAIAAIKETTGVLRKTAQGKWELDTSISSGVSSGEITTGLGYTPVPDTRTLTINGVAYDLTQNRSWTIAGGVTSFNTRTGAITLLSSDITSTLGYTPYSAANPNGYISSYTETDPTVGSHIKAITTTNISNWDTAYGWGNHASAGYLTGITSSQVTTALGFTPENAANKGVANGYASLDGSGLVPATQLPSYVDDVLEYTNFTFFPGTGVTGKIYVALDTNKIYRWSGSTYIEVSPTVGESDPVFVASPAYGITATNITNWNTAYNWSNHATAGYLLSSTASTTYVPLTRTITINGTAYDLSANRSWSINSMVYPGAGIAVSTGTAWGTSITDNSANWNTAYSWGNHASAGYLTTSSAASTYLTISTAASTYLTSATAATTYVPQTRTLTINGTTFDLTANRSWTISTGSSALSALSDVTITSVANEQLLQYSSASSKWVNWTPNYLTSYTETDTLQTVTTRGATTTTSLTAASFIRTGGTSSQFLKADGSVDSTTYYSASNPNGYITGYTETDTLASVTGRGATTTTAIDVQNRVYSRASQTDNNYTTAALWTQSFSSTTTGIAFHISGNVGKFLEMRTNGTLYWDNNTVWTAGTLTNLNQLTNGPGYTTNTGTVTSVSGTGSYGGLTLSGTVTTSGSLTLGGTPSGTWPISVSGNAATAAILQTARNINGVSFNGSADIIVPSIYDSGYTRITNPAGGAYTTATATVTGAIAVTLPVGMNSTMMRITIKVYEYATNESFEIHAGGYTYGPGTTWANNPFAYIVGNPTVDRRFTVRLGYNSTSGKAIIYIGELASTWSYPQVFVTEFQGGYSGLTSTLTSGWSIGFEASAFQSVTATISNCQIGYATSTNTANAVVLRDGSGNFTAGTITAALTGNASTATTLQTARSINGTSFNGSADITTANWGTTRTITIGSTGKSVNGSANVSWTLAEIGAQAAGSYLTSYTETDTLATVLTRGNTSSLGATFGTAGNALYTGAGGLLRVNTNPGSGQSTSILVAGYFGDLSTDSTVDIDFAAVDGNSLLGSQPQARIGYTGAYNGLVNTSPDGEARGYFRIATRGEGSAGVLADRLLIDHTGVVRLLNYTTNGFVKFSNSDGTLTVDNTTYVPTTGTGATGTWGINVTGSAGSVAWSGVSSKPSNLMYYQSFTLDANTMDSNSTGFTYANNAPYNGPVVRFSAGGQYDLWLNAPYLGGGTALAFRTRNGDTSTLNSWRYVLTTDSYNSYAPTLTGTGASGTWGISVTGSAGSVAWSGITSKPTTVSGYGITDFYAQVISGFVTGANSTVLNTDSLEVAIEKLQGQINARGTGNGTVTSVGGTGTVSGLTLSGTVTTSGNLTLGGTLAVTPSNFSSQTANTFLAAPNGAAGVPTFRAIVAADVPTLNQNTTGSAATLTTARTLTIGSTGKTFNGSANVSWTLAEIGAQASNTNLTSVAALSYVSASFVKMTAAGTFSLDTNTYATSSSIGNGTLTLAVSGTGLSGSATFTANQSTGSTFTVTSNATSANTVSTIVARDASGNFSAGAITCVSLTETSSIKYKENVDTLNGALESVLQLRGVSYNKIGNQYRELGVIAEEVNMVIPEVVAKNPDGSVEAVSYGRLTAVLIEAVKEQQKQMDEQKKQIDELKAMLGK